jgi:hypothetical protein
MLAAFAIVHYADANSSNITKVKLKNLCRTGPGACTMKPPNFHPSLIFSGKDRSPPLECSPVRGSTLLSSCLACKYQTRVEVDGGGKHSSLLR